MSSPSSSNANSPRRPKSRRTVFLVTMFSVFAVLFLIPIWYGLSYRSGEEFSPDDFSMRHYEYRKDPLFGVVLMNIKYEKIDSPVIAHLLQMGFIKPVGKQPQTWHLLWDSSSRDQGKLPKDCDARFLRNYLEKTDEELDYYWIQWNADHPKSAVEFWPAVASLARDEMYLALPKVMDFAIGFQNDNPEVFKAELDSILAQAYLDLGDLDLQLGRDQRGKERLKKSIAIKPSEEANLILQRLK